MHDLRLYGLVNYALNRGGSIHPVILPKELTGETGLMNPSVYVHDGRILINVRHVNYILYHSEAKKFPHQWGPLLYVHPENDVTLTTHNIMCELDDNMKLIHSGRVNMALDTGRPTWNFIGLEDCRLFSWENRIFLCGVRRDAYDDQGTGRMEMAEIEFRNGEWVEVSRNPIPAPGDDSSYCEKNWMPIMDMPYHFVKWCNPTEVIHYEIENRKTTTKKLEKEKFYTQFNQDLRGGSQVVGIGDGKRMAFVHETNLHKDTFVRKDGNYSHRVVVWDEDWNIVHSTKSFYMMGTHFEHSKATEYTIEFITGTAFYKNDILISYGLSDNACFVLRMPQEAFFDFLAKG